MNFNSYKKLFILPISALRGLAVLMVVLFHYYPDIFPRYHIGVNIFFVISGFVISKSILTNLDYHDYPKNLIHFYKRRINRIFPTLFIATLIGVLLSIMFIPNPRVSILTALTALYGFSNFYLIRQSTDYFSASADLNPFLQTWSLSVEEQFYLLFPLFFIAICFYIKKFTNTSLKFLSLLLSVSASIFLLLYFASLYLGQVFPFSFYLNSVSYFWEILGGVLSQLIFLVIAERVSSQNAASKINCFAFSALLVFIALPVISWSNFLDSYHNLTIFLVSCFCVFASLSAYGRNCSDASEVITVATPGFFNSTVFNNLRQYSFSFFLFLGNISFSLYLYHWFFVCFLRWSSFPVNNMSKALALLGSLIVSTISFLFVEKSSSKLNSILCFSGFKKYFSTLAFSSIVLFSLTAPSLKKIYAGLHPRYSKYISVASQPAYEKLPVQARHVGHNILMIGDSHVHQLRASIKSSLAYKSDNELIRFYSLPYPNCPSAMGCGSDKRLPAEEEQSLLRKNLLLFENMDLVVFSVARDRMYRSYRNNRLFYTVFSGKNRSSYSGDVSMKRSLELTGFLNIILQYFSSRDIPVLLVDDLPKFCSPIEFTKFLLSDDVNCRTVKDISLGDRQPLTSSLTLLADIFPGIHYVDPHDMYCGNVFCVPLRNRDPAFRDSSPHVTEKNKYYMKNMFESLSSQVFDKKQPIFGTNSSD